VGDNEIEGLYCYNCAKSGKDEVTATVVASVVSASLYQIVVGVDIVCNECGNVIPAEIPTVVAYW